MEESKKKPIMIGVIIVCLVAAGAIIITRRSKKKGASTAAFKGIQVWVKCSNEDCGAAYQMDKQEYFDSIRKLTRENLFLMQTPPLVCEKCGKESIYRAEKCEKCGLIFFRGAAGRGELPDKCPECGYSPMEELRKQAKEAK